VEAGFDAARVGFDRRRSPSSSGFGGGFAVPGDSTRGETTREFNLQIGVDAPECRLRLARRSRRSTASTSSRRATNAATFARAKEIGVSGVESDNFGVFAGWE
jgi:hypothetical protein